MSSRGPNWTMYLLLAAICLAPWQLLRAAEQRLALVIGNSNYTDSPLSNPYNDATDMAAVLEDLSFDVILVTDADRREMGKAIREFGRRLRKNRGVGLFYYAGHGMQLENRNYLIPVDAPMQEEDEVPYESIEVDSVLAKMQSAGNPLNLLILDACRNNPFPNRFRSSNRGLARVDAPIGSLVVHATAPGMVAADGKGRNGTFTGHLLENLREPGLNLTQIIRRTRAAVVEETGGRQVPWESSSLLKEYYLQPVETPAPEPTVDGTEQQDLLFWKSVQATGSAEEYQAYLTQGPTGWGADLARARIASGLYAEQPAAEQSIPAPPKPAAVVKPATNEPLLADNTDAASKTAPKINKAIKPAKSGSESAYVAIAPETLSAGFADGFSKDVTRDDTNEAEDTNRGLGSLTVNVTPEDARVRIMNITAKYKPGISLDRGKKYDVYVTHRGYISWRKTFTLEQAELIETVTLEKKTPTYPKMIAVEGGSFRMGCSEGDSACEKFEKPTRTVQINRFAISRTEITVGQFRSFVDATGYRTDAENNSAGFSGCFVWSESGGISRSSASWNWKKGTSWLKPGYHQTDSYPVSCVSWNDALEYASWLSGQTGKLYRLPTEAEWEFAARAGKNTRFHFGNNASRVCGYANGADKSTSPKGAKWTDRAECSDNHWFTAPVASFQPNGLELYDMLGNLREWVADSWSANYKSAASDGSAFTNASSKDKVLRGGAWESGATRLRASARSRGPGSSRASMIGFRLVEVP